MLALLLLFAASVVAKECGQRFPETYQFVDFNEKLEDPASDGVSISYFDENDEPVTNNIDFMNAIRTLNRERVPERNVHAKGTGAFGYFELTHDMSHICKADFLNGVGKRTPVVVRFSTGSGSRGSSDKPRDSRGFAVKFKTCEGNFDLIGFHTETIFFKDPLRFQTFVHAVKEQPSTNLVNYNTYWDAVSENPESFNFFMFIHSHEGIPSDYRHMTGFPLHTYQFVNKYGDNHFCRFAMIPDCGVKSINTKEAAYLDATDPDHSIRDLYESINKGDFPSWTMCLQIISMEDVKKHGSKLFDITRKLSTKDFPLHPVGKLVLNKNVNHFGNEVDKTAFCPCNVINGIPGAPDKTFEARALAYRDAQMYRLGKNHNKIPVNCPLNEIHTFNRDGMPPVGNNEGNATNYYPSSFGKLRPLMDDPRSCKKQGLITIEEEPAGWNNDQLEEFYNEKTDEERQILCDNILLSLKLAIPRIQKKAVKAISTVLPNLGSCLTEGLNVTVSNNNH